MRPSLRNISTQVSILDSFMDYVRFLQVTQKYKRPGSSNIDHESFALNSCVFAWDLSATDITSGVCYLSNLAH